MIAHITDCSNCHCEMVYPIDWEQGGTVDGDEGRRLDVWQVTLRCPNCELVRYDIMDEDEIYEFDCILDRASDSLARDLRNLEYANMHAEIVVWTHALAVDAILPEDFATSPPRGRR